MPQQLHTDDRDSVGDVEFYLPAGLTPLFGVRRLERIWARLSSDRVDPPK